MTIVRYENTHGVQLSGVLNFTCDTLDIGDGCTDCGRDTSPGSGLWVNRIPSGDMHNGCEIIGYLCADCQAEECGGCGEQTIEYGAAPDGSGLWCDDCRDAAEGTGDDAPNGAA
jgi:hypothetical protein